MVKLKICGITNADDMRLAARLGADFVGFNFVRNSPRRITPAHCREIVAAAGGRCRRVGIFVNDSPARIRRIAAACRLDIVQLHGDETPEFCRGLHLPYWKAIRVRDTASLSAIGDYPGAAILLDAFTAGAYGGSGRYIDPALVQAAFSWGSKIVLAGGVSTATLAAAWAFLPYAIDVCSSLEHSPGKKDEAKMREFFTAFAALRGSA